MRRCVYSAPCQPSTKTFVAGHFPVCVDLRAMLSVFLSSSLTLWFYASASCSLLLLFFTETWVTTRYQSWPRMPSKVCALSTRCEYCVVCLYWSCIFLNTLKHRFEGTKKFKICLCSITSVYFSLLVTAFIFYVNNALRSLISEICYGHNILRKRNRKQETQTQTVGFSHNSVAKLQQPLH